MKILLLCLSLVLVPLENNGNIYSSFSLYKETDYQRLIKLQNLNNYSPLETINIYYTQNFHKANFPTYYLTLINKFFKFDQEAYDLVEIDDYKILHPSILKSTKDNIKLNRKTLEAYIKMIESLNKIYPTLNNLYIFSGYRTYDYQETIYNQALDKSYVARAYYSEHHSGLAIDISTLNFGLTKHFEDSLEFKILEKECANYGFILRYPKEKVAITGYSYEPWHFRYVGVEHSKFIYENKLCLEEYIFQNFEL